MPDTTVEELWTRWRERADTTARDRLLLHYSPLVKFVAGRLAAGMPSTVTQADLISDGLVGLLDALTRFDPSRGVQFQTYAVTRVRGAMHDGLRKEDRVPRSVRDRIRAQDRAMAELELRLGRAPTDDDVAQALGVSPQAVRKTRNEKVHATTVRLEPADVTDHLVLQATAPAADDANQLPAGFSDAMRLLRERDQIVLALYYWEGLSLVEIGRVLGVGESRVSQLHTRATSALRSALASR